MIAGLAADAHASASARCGLSPRCGSSHRDRLRLTEVARRSRPQSSDGERWIADPDRAPRARSAGCQQAGATPSSLRARTPGTPIRSADPVRDLSARHLFAYADVRHRQCGRRVPRLPQVFQRCLVRTQALLLERVQAIDRRHGSLLRAAKSQYVRCDSCRSCGSRLERGGSPRSQSAQQALPAVYERWSQSSMLLRSGAGSAR